jgi:hypothetical protein
MLEAGTFDIAHLDPWLRGFAVGPESWVQIVLSKPAKAVRSGWAQAAAAVAKTLTAVLATLQEVFAE